MDQQTTDQLRKRLTGEEVALLRQLQELGARHDTDGIERPFLEEGFADAGQATAERVNLLTMVKSLRDTLHEVQEALKRMDAGTYGVCQRCGKPVAEERLEALPATRLCISCKRAR
jgi:DnaK suppressor protein